MTTVTMYTIYERPRDYPDSFAVREMAVTSQLPVMGRFIGVADDLEAARSLVPPGYDTCLTRADDDDPTIVETWI